MGKDSIRTLKNINYNSKKNSKNSKKSKKNKNNGDPTTSEEMRLILDSDSETHNKPSVRNFLSKNLAPYNEDMSQPMSVPNQMGMQNQMMGMQNQMMGMPNQMMGMQNQMGMQNPLQMFSPSNYDPLMLQQIAPLQTAQAMAEGRPGNLLTPNAMANGLAGFARSGPSMIGGGYLRRLR